MVRAYYSASVVDFLQATPESLLGSLTQQHAFALEDLQKQAWLAQFRILKQNLTWLPDGSHVLFEYSIPRMGKRVDVILLVQGVIFIVEFKVGDDQYTSHALDQVLDYALDLKNFHAGSHDRLLVPILVATKASDARNDLRGYEDQVYVPLRANAATLGSTIRAALSSFPPQTKLDPLAWRDAPYKPTPTIIEAAQALYQGHNVREISRSDAGATNLSSTTEAVAEIIRSAKTNHHKAICFITGVPGAGKTLAGLNIANDRLSDDRGEQAVFLSGNGPLVTVLREALARDEYQRSQTQPQRLTKKKARSKVEAFIQNIHHFRDDALISNRPPHERVAIFDEAQRAWTREQTAIFMQRKRNQSDFSMSEPEFLISIMDRHPDWAVIVCLVGGGQEINTGEAGLLEWFQAVRSRFPHWQVYCSPNLSDDEYLQGDTLENQLSGQQVNLEPRLHLAMSVRSFRAERVSTLVKALLDNKLAQSQQLLQEVIQRYPIFLTREIGQAKQWLRSKARASERYGLLASSGGLRLRAVGVNVRAQIDVANWFLADKDDVRSSFFLEEVATEFDIQGLELDWTGVVWDADLRHLNQKWSYHNFVGNKWHTVRDSVRRRYLMNAYRVLLTRARQGMVIVVPVGDPDDKTRPPEFYDGTYEFLRQVGIPTI